MADLADLAEWRRTGDPELFRGIASTHAPMVFRTCLRILRDHHLAQEAAQETFITLTRTARLPQGHLAAWLHVVAANHARKQLRAARRRLQREARFTVADAQTPDHALNEILQTVDECIQELPDSIRVPLVAHYLQGESQTALAEHYGITRQAIAARIARGVEQVRESLKKRGILVTAAALTGILASESAQAVPASLILSIGKLAVAGPLPGTVATGSLAGWAAWKVALFLFTVGALSAGLLIFSGNQSRAEDLPRRAQAAPSPSLPHATEAAAQRTAPELSLPATREHADAAPFEKAAASGPGSISGMVFGKSGEPLPGTRIQIREIYNGQDLDWTPKPPREYLTDEHGEFLAAGLPFAVYGVLALGEGDAAFDSVALREGQAVAATEFRLKAALPVQGRVIDAAGNAVADAVVVPVAKDGQEVDFEVQSVLWTQTEESGGFLFPALPSGAWELHCSVQGKGVATSAPVQAGKQDVVLELKRGLSLNGLALDDATGVALPSVPVVLQQERVFLPLPVFQRTAEDGSFSFDGLLPGRCSVQPSGDYLPASETVSPISLGLGDEFMELRIKKASHILGTVVWEDTGAPLAGASISVKRIGESFQSSFRSDAEGKFDVKGAAPSVYQLTLEPPHGTGEAVNVALGVAGAQEEVRLAAPRQQGLQGRVVDTQGRPVASAEVQGTVGARPISYGARSLQTDANGEFLITPVTDDDTVKLTARDSSAESLPFGPVLVSDIQGELRLELTQPRDSSISGIVVNDSGQPVDGRVLLYQGRSAESRLADMDTLNEDGSFHFLRLSGGGEYTIHYQKKPGPQEEIHTLSLQPGQRLRGLRLVRSEAGYEPVAGIIRDFEGNPKSAEVRLQSISRSGTLGAHRTQTDTDGRFRFEKVAPGDYMLSTGGDSYSAANLYPVRPGDVDIEVVVDLHATIARKVVDSRGLPVKHYSISALPDSALGNSQSWAMKAMESSSGEFELDVEMKSAASTEAARQDVQALPYSILATAPGCGITRVELGDIAPGDSRRGLVVTLEPGGPLKGIVVNAQGLPVAGATIRIAMGEGDMSLSGGNVITFSNEEGLFDIEVPREDATRVCALHDTEGSGRAVLAEDGTLSITLEAYGSLAGHVRQGGAPVEGATVFASRKQVKTEADGSFLLELVPAGECHLSASLQDERGGLLASCSTKIQISPGKETSVDLELEAQP